MSDESGAIDDSVTADVLVAGAAASAAVALTLVSRFLVDVPIGLLARMAPLAVYPLYLLLGRGQTGSVVEDPRLWAGVALLVAFLVFGIALY